MPELPLREVATQLDKSQRVVIGTHPAPDGDALGSALALARFLRSLGKEALILVTGGVPRAFGWMAAPGEVEDYLPARHAGAIAGADAIVVVDIANWERLGPMHAPVMGSPAVRIDLDHHPGSACPADLVINDPAAAAVGEIVRRLIGVMGGTLTREIAEPLYVSLVTDTGSFKYSNTHIGSHALASECLALGILPYEVHTRVYERAPEGRLRLLGAALSRLEVDLPARLAWTSIPHALFGASSACEEDTEGIIDQVRSLEGVEVAAVFKEPEPGVVKVSFRSKGAVDVNALARRFGGGGHARAAGLTRTATLARVMAEVLAAAREATREAARGA